MGKHPVSTTIDIELNKELDTICHGHCSKYSFIREAIKEKVKNEREKTKRPDSGAPRPTGKVDVEDIDA